MGFTETGPGAAVGTGRAHAKAILIGEHTVVYSLPAIAIPIHALKAPKASHTPKTTTVTSTSLAPCPISSSATANTIRSARTHCTGSAAAHPAHPATTPAASRSSPPPPCCAPAVTTSRPNQPGRADARPHPERSTR